MNGEKKNNLLSYISIVSVSLALIASGVGYGITKNKADSTEKRFDILLIDYGRTKDGLHESIKGLTATNASLQKQVELLQGSINDLRQEIRLLRENK